MPTLCTFCVIFADGDMHSQHHEGRNWLKEEVLWRQEDGPVLALKNDKMAESYDWNFKGHHNKEKLTFAWLRVI